MLSQPHRRPPVAALAATPLRAPRAVLRLRRRRMRWVVGASVALHLAVLLLFIRIVPTPSPEFSPPPSDVAVVFEAAKPPGSPQPKLPAQTSAAPVPTSEPPATPLPAPAPAASVPPVAQPATPQVRAPLDQLAMLPPPMPQPPQPARQHPAPRPPARADDFPRPLTQNWFFPSAGGAPATASRHAAITMGPSGNQDGDLQGAQALGPDWGGELKAYVEAHARYPEQAAQNGEQGDSMVQVTVDSDGHVKSVSLEQRSGSVWLDAELLSIFRHARLPPFPAGTGQPEITFHFTLHYILRS